MERLVDYVTDRQKLYSILSTDPLTCAYMLCDMEGAYRHYCRWYGSSKDGEFEALLLVYSALSMPVLITYGQTSALEEILSQYRSEMPGRCLVHLQPHHVTAVDRYFSSDALVPTLRMGLNKSDFKMAFQNDCQIEWLTHRHTGEIIQLYSNYYPDNYFEPAQLESGHYCGIRRGSALVSVAGVHVVSPKAKLAVLGNIVTQPDYRGQGLSTACTSLLCQQLFTEGIEHLALNVQRQNRGAVRVYEKLGFRYHDTYLEGLASSVPAYG